MSIKHRTIAKAGVAALALSFIMMLALAGCPTEDDSGGGGGGGGGQSLSGTIKILNGVNDIPYASPGDTLVAVYNGPEAVTYQWNKDGTAISGETGQIYIPTAEGQYTVTVSKAGYQSKTSAHIGVHGSALSTLPGTVKIQKDGNDVTTANTGDTLTAVYSGTETVTYQWNKNGSAITGETYTTYTPAEAGSYIVIVKAANYAGKPSAAVTVSGTKIGVKNEDLAAHLAALTGNSAAAPSTVILAPQTLEQLAPFSSGFSIAKTVKDSGKYVVLDLSHCTIPAEKMKGSSSTGGHFSDRIKLYGIDGGHIVGLILPSGIVIDDYAFINCDSLKSITIPAGVTSIGAGAFSGCAALTKITIPGSVASIGAGAFGGCTHLEEVTIQEGVTSIGHGAFYQCTALAEIIIPDGVISIGTSTGNGAFEGCTALKNITIPGSVQTIGRYTLNACALDTVTILEGVTSIPWQAFGNAANNDSETKKLIIPGSIISINDSGIRVRESVTFGAGSNIPAANYPVGSSTATDRYGLSSGIQYWYFQEVSADRSPAGTYVYTGSVSSGTWVKQQPE
ncbi:MAG: leucine-rich repeat protein [Treponema sp.]|jgi:hypothetical protein|nr:leucine-rich repeat protein [Treponema sp.]